MLLSPACRDFSMNVNEVTALGSAEEAARSLGVTIPAGLARAIEKRRVEFIAGRACAQRALAAAGFVGACDVGIQHETRAPLWPAGFVGSIAHTSVSAWAAVALASKVRGLGIDLERVLDAKSARNLERMILRPEEKARAKESGLSFARYVSVLFSAKESLYKCLFPLTGVFFGFQDAEAFDVDEGRGCLRFRLHKELSGEFGLGFEIEGRFLIGGEVRSVVEMPGA